MSTSRLCVQYASTCTAPRPTGIPRHYCYPVISASGQRYATSVRSSHLPRASIDLLPQDRRWMSSAGGTGRLEFHPPSRRSEHVKLAPSLLLLGGTGLLGYYLYVPALSLHTICACCTPPRRGIVSSYQNIYEAGTKRCSCFYKLSSATMILMLMRLFVLGMVCTRNRKCGHQM